MKIKIFNHFPFVHPFIVSLGQRVARVIRTASSVLIVLEDWLGQTLT